MYPRIRDLREDKDLTQKQVGEILNMSQTGYNQYEIGKNDIPTRVLIELSKFYDTSVDYILGLTDESKPYKRKWVVLKNNSFSFLNFLDVSPKIFYSFLLSFKK